jgi:hypothetical protein
MKIAPRLLYHGLSEIIWLQALPALRGANNEKRSGMSMDVERRSKMKAKKFFGRA